MTDYLTTAYELLAQGFSVIPSGGGESGKAPIIKWEPYQARLPDKKELEHWDFKDKPRLWGIVTGSISGIVVIDTDNAEAMARIEATGLTPHIITPRGGAHFYFAHPGYPVKTMAGLLPKIDIRADGGFVNTIGKRKDGEYKTLNLPTRQNLIPWGSLPEFIARAIEVDTDAIKPKPGDSGIIAEGQRNSHLTSLAGTMRKRGFDQTAIEAALLQENRAKCKPELAEAEVLTIAKSVARYQPGLAPPPKKAPTITLPKATRVNIKGVQPELVKWLWYPYIPLGKLTLLEGDPGVGKSWVALAIATAISLGADLPEQKNGYTPYQGPVLLASAEDGLADTIRPRLDAMKANLDIIDAIKDLFTLDDPGFDYLENQIADCYPALVIIDPLVAYLSGEMDINKANQVRFATARIARIADKYGPAIVAVRHLTKGGSQKPVYRGLGSIDFTASARSVLMAGSDPDDPSIRGIVHIKSNLAPVGDAIGYELREGNFYWTGYSDLTYSRITSLSDSGSALTDAKRFLSEALSAGAVPAGELFTEAKDRDLSKRTLDRAKADLGIKVIKQGEKGKRGGGGWVWQLPEGVKTGD